MRQRKRRTQIILSLALFSLVIVLGGWSIKSIVQPLSAQPGEIITVEVEIESSSGGTPTEAIFGLRLPPGWNVVGNPPYSGDISGTLTYSGTLAAELNTTPEDTWWAGAGPPATWPGTAKATVVITLQTAMTPGNYGLEYIAGFKNGGGNSWGEKEQASTLINWQLFLPLIVKSPTPTPSDFAVRVTARTNYYRAQNGCPALTLHTQLTNAGQRHSEDMAINDFFSHTGSDGSSPWDRIHAAGYQYSRAAENIAAGYPTPEAVVDGWMQRSGHRSNILNCALQDIGVGYYYLENDTGNVNYKHYWTQVFATP